MATPTKRQHLINFLRAGQALLQAWEATADKGELNLMYPFDKSFDEVINDVDRWVQDSVERLDRNITISESCCDNRNNHRYLYEKRSECPSYYEEDNAMLEKEMNMIVCCVCGEEIDTIAFDDLECVAVQSEGLEVAT
jgi:hypothetical protein